jgi:hypothetical protein
MLNDYYEYLISDTFLSALFNGDESGLNHEEILALTQFFECLPPEAVDGTWELVDESEGRFYRCVITHLHANCVIVRLHFHNEALTQGE